MKLLNEILQKIKPKNNSVKKEIDEIISNINKELKKNKIKADVIVGGSFAKNTHLIGDYDCDIFVRFDYKYKDDNISDKLAKVLKQFKANRVHGSRDYFQFTKSLNYEVVPVLKIVKAKDAVNVTDASPLHVAWVRKQKKNDEIRLAKAFCKALNIYGAESHIKGFSGHVLDILTAHYGCFLKLLKASQKWKDKQVVDIQKYHKDALFVLNTSKTSGPLIVVDPIQKDRNAAAALSYESVETFKQKAKEFLSKPSAKFFEKKHLTKKDFPGAIIIDIIPLEGKRDVVGAKILKVHEAILRMLEKADFEVKDSGWVWDNETFIWFKMKKDNLDYQKVIKGPPINMVDFALNFKRNHADVFEKKGILYARINRKYVNAVDLIKDALKNEEVKNKVKSAKVER